MSAPELQTGTGGRHEDLGKRIAGLSPPKLALLFERLSALVPESTATGSPSIRKRRWGDDTRPLSSAQRRLWLADQLAGSGDYNVPIALRLRGPLDPRTAERAVGEVIRRHEVLRASFRDVDGQPVQTVHPCLQLASMRIDLCGLAPQRRAHELVRQARSEALRPFDLGRAPLLRLCWIELGTDDRALLLTLHHIVCDDWSIRVLTGEVMELYRSFSAGNRPRLSALPIQYADYVSEMSERLAAEEQRLVDWWREYLRDAPSTVELRRRRSSAMAEAAGDAPHRAEETFQLDAELTAALRTLGREERSTPFMVLAALLTALLHAESGQEDLCLGANAAHRGSFETEGLIGFFINQIVLRVRPRGSFGFRELLRHVRDVTQDAHAHQDLPFERLTTVLRAERGDRPLFQVKVDYQEDLPPLRLAGIEVEEFDVVEVPLRCDLLLLGVGSADRVDCTLSYDQDRFDAAAIRAMVEKLVALAGLACAGPERSLDELGSRAAEQLAHRRNAERERLSQVGARKLGGARRKGVRLQTHQETSP